MLVDLVRTRTPDGWFLDGALQMPESAARPALPFDAVLLIHGTGSNFYQSSLLEFLAERFRERGVATLRGNTRGHDGISTLVGERGGRRLGAAYEIVDDCRYDLAGWIEFLRDRCGSRVAIVGHSLGAVKALYATAHEPALNPALIVAVSPPRLSYEVFCGSAKSVKFLEDYRRAEALVAEGRGGAMLDVTMPLPMAIAAAGYVEKYGPDARYDFVPLLRRIKCPLLVTFGAKEVTDNVAFQGLPELVGPRAAIVAEADHFYAGRREELWTAIAAAL
jgi:pimeloyl-ACP methyl ester carboxylesterase